MAHTELDLRERRKIANWRYAKTPPSDQMHRRQSHCTGERLPFRPTLLSAKHQCQKGQPQQCLRCPAGCYRRQTSKSGILLDNYFHPGDAGALAMPGYIQTEVSKDTEE